MNLFAKFKLLPLSTRRLLGIGIILALAIALPLFVWAIVTQKFLIVKHAATGEPGVCVAVNKVITVTPNSDPNGTCHDIQAAVDAATGDNYTVLIEPGNYYPSTQINVTGKSLLNITGNSSNGNSAAVINFVPGGFGFLVQNSSGGIQWLTIKGGSSNGMLSVQNSQNFSIAYDNISSDSSHTLDIQGSNNISVFNSDIQSSAGAIEVTSSHTVSIANNKIHNSANGISVNNSSDMTILANLITYNTESAIRMQSFQNITIQHNSMLYDGTNGSPTLDISGNSSLMYLYENIIAFGGGSGVHKDSNNITMTVGQNDVFNNPHLNYDNMTDYTAAGVNGNISADPKINTDPQYGYCLLSGSPAIYGSVSQPSYMGYIGACSSGASPSPTASPSAPAIHVLTPNGGENLTSGQVYRISWTSTPSVSTVTLIYHNNSANQTIISNLPNVGYYDWTVPTLANGVNNQFRIQISSQASGIFVEDFSDNLFTISTSNSPSPSPSATPQVLSFLIRFGGVSDGSAQGSKVKVYLQTPTDLVETPPIAADYQGSGIYKISFIPSPSLPTTNDPPATVIKYPLYLKGEKHIKVRYCTINSVLTRCVGSSGASDGINIDPQGGTYDLTAYSLEPGDLYPQDGVANLADFTKIIQLMGKAHSDLTAQDLLTGDLNYDGYINVKDAFLMRQSLETRYDDF